MLDHSLKHIEASQLHLAELRWADGGRNRAEYPSGICRTVAAELASLSGQPFVTAPNKGPEALATVGCPVHAHGALKGSAASLMKIANDVRWLASALVALVKSPSRKVNEPGSSIMPGKVNPTQCEALTMVCCRDGQRRGGEYRQRFRATLSWNADRPMVIHNFLQSVRLLADGMASFNEHCAVEPNRERISQLLNESLMLELLR
ncbi:hypothetical protein MJ561_13760 [Klebsiella pneumoniae]|nr:hypothetical protein MJ561_13760 [Klebsiella pneumoniae]